MPVTAIYPGTFDPITNGHSDLAARATRLFDGLVIAVAESPAKEPMFSVDERLAFVRAAVGHLAGVRVIGFSGLLVACARRVGASAIIRGLRAVSDFEYEFQMAGMNARLNPDIETVFLTASERHHFIASRLVKEIAALGGDITSFVSPRVAARVAERFGRGDFQAVAE
jgi:pantetheine-phosphate adenylyltransferase